MPPDLPAASQRCSHVENHSMTRPPRLPGMLTGAGARRRSSRDAHGYQSSPGVYATRCGQTVRSEQDI
jgi:hypothetical protein